MQSVCSKKLVYSPNSEEIFDRLRGLNDVVWLDSGQPKSTQGRFDILSGDPDCLIETWGDTSTITHDAKTRSSSGDPFDLIKNLLEPLRSPETDPRPNVPFTCGIIGYFGYDLRRQYYRLDAHNPPAANIPDMRVARYLWSVVVDHQEKSTRVYFHTFCPQKLRQKVTAALSDVTSIVHSKQQPFRLKHKFLADIDATEYQRNISKIQQLIDAGDCYQVNYSQHFKAAYQGDTWQAYKALREILPSPYSAYWQWQDKALMSLSPERFLSSDGHEVESKPIKGTRPRGHNHTADQSLAQSLVESSKDRAENVMIVDLLRNDLSKNACLGSVEVSKLFALETFPNVHHLVSTVTAKIKAEKTALDVLKDCFPGGSITGAPKQRAMQIIEELESVRRSVYCGSIGYISADLTMDTNIAIRTVVAEGQSLHCWGGGGIVADSNPSEEYAESLTKVNVILKTLEAF